MNTLDIISLVIVTLLTLLGIWHGFLRGVFRLMAWIFAIVGAYYANVLFSDSVSSIGFGTFSTTIICLALGFLVPFITLHFAGFLVNRAIKDTKFGTADKVLGGILGFIKAFLVLFAFFSILHIMPFGETLISTRNDAATYSIYKTTLELMGFSSEPMDLVDVAEKKASELVEKASDKASEVAKEATDKAVNAAKDAAADVAKEVTDKAADEAKKMISDKVSETVESK